MKYKIVPAHGTFFNNPRRETDSPAIPRRVGNGGDDGGPRAGWMSRGNTSTYKTLNWPAYKNALKRRGSLTMQFCSA
jgi:hypothetical protein